MNFEDFLRWHNITLRIAKLPTTVKGFSYYNGSSYLVIINSRCSSYQQQETLVHEMIHIFENHFSCLSGYEDKCEKEVNKIIKEVKKIYNIEKL